MIRDYDTASNIKSGGYAEKNAMEGHRKRRDHGTQALCAGDRVPRALAAHNMAGNDPERTRLLDGTPQ